MSDEEPDVSLWDRYRDIYQEWLEGDDEVLRAIAKVVKAHWGNES